MVCLDLKLYRFLPSRQVLHVFKVYHVYECVKIVTICFMLVIMNLVSFFMLLPVILIPIYWLVYQVIYYVHLQYICMKPCIISNFLSIFFKKVFHLSFHKSISSNTLTIFCSIFGTKNPFFCLDNNVKG